MSNSPAEHHQPERKAHPFWTGLKFLGTVGLGYVTLVELAQFDVIPAVAAGILTYALYNSFKNDLSPPHRSQFTHA